MYCTISLCQNTSDFRCLYVYAETQLQYIVNGNETAVFLNRKYKFFTQFNWNNFSSKVTKTKSF